MKLYMIKSNIDVWELCWENTQDINQDQKGELEQIMMVDGRTML